MPSPSLLPLLHLHSKMTCVYCNAAWCWRCERRIEGYDHFRTGGCRLFEQSETDRWNRAMWENQRAHEVERRQIVVQVCVCARGLS